MTSLDSRRGGDPPALLSPDAEDGGRAKARRAHPRGARRRERVRPPASTQRGRPQPRPPARCPDDRPRDRPWRYPRLGSTSGGPQEGSLATVVALVDRVGPSVVVEYGSCGSRFELATRNERRYRSEGRAPTCETCRRPALKLTPAERERFRRWWLEESGLSRRELREIAVGLSTSD